jgi:hypothetical protein
MALSDVLFEACEGIRHFLSARSAIDYDPAIGARLLPLVEEMDPPRAGRAHRHRHDRGRAGGRHSRADCRRRGISMRLRCRGDGVRQCLLVPAMLSERARQRRLRMAITGKVQEEDE